MDTLIQVSNLSKRFLLPKQRKETVREHVFGFFRRREYEDFYALKNVSFRVEKGEFLGVVGGNGSGKSTLLKILSGIYVADSGRVEVMGKVSSFLELGIGFNPELTGRENVYLNGMLLGMSRREVDLKYNEIVRFSGLERFMDVPLKHYSSGMHSRLAFSTAIQVESDIYLMDEVLAVGDQAFAEQCFKVFDEWKRSGKTVILVSHSPESVRRYCDRALWLDSGQLVVDDRIDEVLNAYSA